jgi:hypothetical protein
MITAEKLRETLSYDHGTGIFTWKVRRSGVFRQHAGSRFVGLRGKVYHRITLGGRQYLAHRLAWLYVYGEFPELLIDHVNGDGTDNRIENLRLASPSQNRQNARINSNNKSGVKGVSFISACNLWQADISANGKAHRLGRFKTKEEAVRARKNAEARLHGDFRFVDVAHGVIP